MMSREIVLKHLAFTGPSKSLAQLEFDEKLSLIWGASNTGKSFTLKALDFMFGGSKPLPDITESQGYDNVWLALTLPQQGDVTLSRALVGGGFLLHQGHVTAAIVGQNVRSLQPRHDPIQDENLSAMLLSELGLRGKQVVTTAHGQKRSLSIRDLDLTFLVDETSMQIERSPIEGGQRDDKTVEHSVFRLLLTGLDDDAVVPVDDPKKFNAAKKVRLEVVNDMITEIDQALTTEYVDTADLDAQLNRLEAPLREANETFTLLRTSVRELVAEKQRLSVLIPKCGARLEEVTLHIERFEQLQEVYASDIQRLEALEEVGFLLNLPIDRPCPLCGAPSDAQVHDHDHAHIDTVRNAALVEIAKLRKQQGDLIAALRDLQEEQDILKGLLPNFVMDLEELEEKIASAAPEVSQSQATLTDIISARDHAKRGLGLIAQKDDLLRKRSEYERSKATSRADRPVLMIPGGVSHEFAQTVSHVLTEWGFPGQRHVSFDDGTYDLKIDGKSRTANGKGVRAVTHAAFKVALLLYCLERDLPHPGFLVLDTPLLTYRDPLKNPKHGELEADERELAQTPLKDRFFDHLASLEKQAQFIILENVDPPQSLIGRARIEVFSGASEGRKGLFPAAS